MLRISRSLVYEMAAAGVLHRTARGRYSAASVEKLLNGETTWPPVAKPAAPKATAPTGTTKRASSTASASRSTGRSTPSLTLIDRGRKLDLEI